MRGYCYLLASKKNGTLYCGVTSDLPRRIFEHREGRIKGFTKRYSIKRLVWYEEFPWMIDAIKREKAIKHWPRAWKIALIEKENPDWRDLYPHLLMFWRGGGRSGCYDADRGKRRLILRRHART